MNYPQDEWVPQRRQMVEEQLRRRQINDARVLQAMATIPRERFVPAPIRHEAYEDRALTVGHGQTISQPFIVAYMTQALRPGNSDRVLEVGTGTGYQTAVLAMLCGHVTSVERIASLQKNASVLLASLGCQNVTLVVGDGSMGAAEHAPFDRIIVTAAAPSVPAALIDQLADGGIMVIPVGAATEQTLVRVVRDGARHHEEPLLACRFVKLVGREGWNADGD